MKKYWFYLEPFTFIFSKNEKILLYNTLSGDNKVFKNTSSIKKTISLLQEASNMYCIELTEKDMEMEGMKEMLNFVRESFSGDFIDVLKINKPLVIPPVLTVEHNVERLNQLVFRSSGEEVFHFLKEVSFYLGGGNPKSSLNHIDVYKQFDYCQKSLNDEYLSFTQIQNYLNSINDSSVTKINILGGNIFSHPNLDILMDKLCNLSATKYLYSAYEDIPNSIEKFPFLIFPNFTLKILLDFPINIHQLNRTIDFLHKNNCVFECLFAITSIEEYEQVENIVNKCDIEKFDIKPVFTGRNINFFKENIYLSESDILETKLSRRDIFVKQALNIFNFGKISIMTDGKIYSDLNISSIGELSTPLIEVLHNEMSDSKSWLRIRNQEPCDQCVYQWLCPSPSGYEHAIGKPNLCSVK